MTPIIITRYGLITLDIMNVPNVEHVRTVQKIVRRKIQLFRDEH